MAKIPYALSALSGMDTLRVQPDIVKYTGGEETAFRVFSENIQLRGNHAKRPLWRGDDQGCFVVTNGAEVHILDFNFDGSKAKRALVRIDSGTVIMENCDFFKGQQWMIEVGPAGVLDLRASQFRDMDKGAIHLKGGRVYSNDALFVNTGKTAIYASSGKLLEVHRTEVVDALATGIELNGVAEVWLDTVTVVNSFQDGVLMDSCNYVFLSSVITQENGRNGLNLSGSDIVGLLNVKALGNLVNGLELHQIDSLRIVGSEFVGNGMSGAALLGVAQSRMANVHFGHNAINGLTLGMGTGLSLANARIQGNPRVGLQLDGIDSISISSSQFINNSTGLMAGEFAVMNSRENLIISNPVSGVRVQHGDKLLEANNLYQGNGVGGHYEHVLNVEIDSCKMLENELGTDFRSIQQLVTRKNHRTMNRSASYYSQLGMIRSQGDLWHNNQVSGVEILSANELMMKDARLTANRNSLLFNQLSVQMENCLIDSGLGMALSGMNATLSVMNTTFSSNEGTMKFTEGSSIELVQSRFYKNDAFLLSEGAVDIRLSYCDVQSARSGLILGDYGKLSIISSRFKEVDGYCIDLHGSSIQSVFLQQNVFQRSGGILKAKSGSSSIDVLNNTFADLLAGFEVSKGGLGIVKQNIFWNTPVDVLKLVSHSQSLDLNCFSLSDKPDVETDWSVRNLFQDPLLTPDLFLKANSPCLTGGENGTLIGALGVKPLRKPTLDP